MSIAEKYEVTPLQLFVLVCCMIGMENDGSIPREQAEQTLKRIEGMPRFLYGPPVPENCFRYDNICEACHKNKRL